MKDYYKILNVPQNASLDEIKNKYKKLAFTYHPDRNKQSDATEKIQEINEAYSVLRNPETRRIYNEKITQKPQQQPTNNVDNAFYYEVEKFIKLFNQKVNIFSALFTDSFYYRNIKKAPDTYVEVPLLMIEMINGCRKTINYYVQDVCTQCNGNQANKVFAFGCMCNGTGLIEIEKKITINFPAGVIPGSEMRITNKGTSGRGLISNGDLVFEIVIQDNEYWCDEELNIYGYYTAIAAEKINIKTPRGIYCAKNTGKDIFFKNLGLLNRKTGEIGKFIAINDNAKNTFINNNNNFFI
jgi:DnaJ-class molecular chaperone